jgi:hypothetical protein
MLMTLSDAERDILTVADATTDTDMSDDVRRLVKGCAAMIRRNRQLGDSFDRREIDHIAAVAKLARNVLNSVSATAGSRLW